MQRPTKRILFQVVAKQINPICFVVFPRTASVVCLPPEQEE